MARVSELATWSTLSAELLSFLGMAAADARLQLQLAAAVDTCDTYVDRDDLEEIPDGMKLGLFEGVRHLRATESRLHGVTWSATGQVSESYSSDGTYSADAMLSHCRSYWRKYKRIIFL